MRRRKRIKRYRPAPRAGRNLIGGLHENVHDKTAGVQAFAQVGMAGPHPFLRIAEKIRPRVQGMAHRRIRRNRPRRAERRPPRTGSKSQHPFSGPHRHHRRYHGYAPPLPVSRGSNNQGSDDRILSICSAIRIPTRKCLFVLRKQRWPPWNLGTECPIFGKLFPNTIPERGRPDTIANEKGPCSVSGARAQD